MAEFRVLGPLEVETDEGPLTLTGHKQRALLALLLIHAGETLSADRIIDALWGEHPPPTAKRSLQNLVHNLRAVLGTDVVATRPQGYALCIGPDDLDLTRFERLLAQARRKPPEDAAGLLHEALALWRGSALADLEYESFADGEIQRLEELRLEALERRAEADLELGAAAELVPELEALVAQHPLRERMRRHLMIALYRSGRQAESMDAYHEGRRRLVDELGIEPGRELQQLYGSILRQESSLDGTRPLPQVADPGADIAKAAMAGRLVVVLGPGAGLRTCAHSRPNGDVLLSPADVAAYLAECFDYPLDGEPDLARVSQYVALMKGLGPLYDELHELFDRDYDPAPVERELAGLATILRQADAPPLLIVSADFDRALERAFAEADEEFDTVCYIGSGRRAGKFLHVSAEGAVAVVDVPNTYVELAPEQRTVILKINGQVDRSPQREWESFVVSEDDYIDFLSAPELAAVVPIGVLSKLRRSHLLFLGYPLSTWHVRVLLHRLWGRERVSYRSWAVQSGPDAVEREAWRDRGVDVVDVDPVSVVRAVSSRLGGEVFA